MKHSHIKAKERRLGNRVGQNRRCWSAWFLGATAAASVTLASTAIAGGSVSLSELLAKRLVTSAPAVQSASPQEAERLRLKAERQFFESRQVQVEVQSFLERSRIPPDDVLCSGIRLGRQWGELGGTRIPPYECQVGDRKLRISGEVEFGDRSKRKLSPKSLNLQSRAAAVEQRLSKWEWIDE